MTTCRHHCIHEAGHIVAAIKLGFKITRASVGLKSGPYTHIDFPKGDWSADYTNARLCEYIVYCSAGAAAEEAILGQQSMGCKSDRKDAIKALMTLKTRQALAKGRAFSLVAHLRTSSAELIRSNMQFTASVAQLLEQAVTLSVSDLERHGLSASQVVTPL